MPLKIPYNWATYTYGLFCAQSDTNGYGRGDLGDLERVHGGYLSFSLPADRGPRTAAGAQARPERVDEVSRCAATGAGETIAIVFGGVLVATRAAAACSSTRKTNKHSRREYLPVHPR